MAAPLRQAGRWFYYAPRPLQLTLVALVIAAPVVAIYYGTEHLKRRAVAREVAASWQDFDAAARHADLPAMRAAIDRVLLLDPGDLLATSRRAGLDAGAADPDDPELAAALMNHHLREERLPEAAREAAKVHARYPRQWRPLCVLAHHALRVGRDKEQARRWLDALPEPEDPAAQLDPGGLIHAIRLCEWLGRDPGPLRRFIVRQLLPGLRGEQARLAPPGGKVQLIDCYLEPFTDLGNLTELGQYWGVVSRLADAALAEAVEAGDAAVLAQLGRQGPRLLAALNRLRDHENIPDDRFAELAREVNGRTRQAWQTLRDRDPTAPEAYGGLVRLAVAERKFPLAMQTLFAGLKACGHPPELLELLTPLAVAGQNPGAALTVTWNAAEKAGTDPRRWCLAAEAAVAAGERPRAIEACARARQVAPSHPWACATEAGLWLEEREPRRALDVLLAVGRPALLAEPSLARRYARALVETGCPLAEMGKTCDELIAATRVRPVAAPVVAFFRGVMEARRPTAERAEWVVRQSQKLADDRPDDAACRRLLADAMFQRAELTNPPWSPDAARAALRAYWELPWAEQGDVAVAASVTMLHLKGLNDVPAAWRAAAPLRDPANAALLRPAQAEALAAVLTAHGDPAAAVRALAPVCTPPSEKQPIPGGTAGCWVQLARAHLANRDPAAARAALDMVALIPDRTPREEFERQEVQRRVQIENR